MRTPFWESYLGILGYGYNLQRNDLVGLKGVFAPFSCPDAYDVLDRDYEDFTVPDPARSRGPHNGLDNLFGLSLGNDDLYFDFRKEIHDVL